MSLRLRPHSFLIPAILLVALFLGPPLSIAKNLPTACNIFDKAKAHKSGPCDHRAMFSKFQDKSLEVEAGLVSHANFEMSLFLMTPQNPLFVFLPFGRNTQSSPLRR
jgi:hypothetical protein